MYILENNHYNRSSSTLSLYMAAECFFLVVRTSKIYYLSNSQTCDTVLITIIATLNITSLGLTYFVT